MSSLHRFGLLRVGSIFKGTKSSVGISLFTVYSLCRKRVVCIATRYRPDRSELEYWWRRDFSHPSRLAVKPKQPPVQWVAEPFPRGTGAGAWS